MIQKHTVMKAETAISPENHHKIIREHLKPGERISIKACGGSMRPFILDRDMVTIAACSPKDLRRGEIGVYLAGDGRLTMHRLLKIEASRYVFRGDATTGAPEWVSGSEVLGRVESVQRDGKLVYRNTALSRWIGILWHKSGALRAFIAKVRRPPPPTEQ